MAYWALCYFYSGCINVSLKLYDRFWLVYIPSGFTLSELNDFSWCFEFSVVREFKNMLCFVMDESVTHLIQVHTQTHRQKTIIIRFILLQVFYTLTNYENALRERSSVCRCSDPIFIWIGLILVLCESLTSGHGKKNYFNLSQHMNSNTWSTIFCYGVVTCPRWPLLSLLTARDRHQHPSWSYKG